MRLDENCGYIYARKCARTKPGGKVPDYVIRQGKAWLHIADGKSKKAYVDGTEQEERYNHNHDSKGRFARANISSVKVEYDNFGVNKKVIDSKEYEKNSQVLLQYLQVTER